MNVPEELFLELVSYFYYAFEANEKKIERCLKKDQKIGLLMLERSAMLRRIEEIEKTGGDSLERLYEKAIHNSLMRHHVFKRA